MSDITSWERSAANNNSAPPDGAPEGMAPSTVNNTMREMMAAVARNRRQYTGTDSGTDAYQFDGNGDLATDDVVDIDIGSANTTATPTLENTGGAPAGAQSIVDVDGNARIGMLEARPHRFQWNATNYVVLDPNTLQTAPSGTGVSLALNTWRTPNADRPTLMTAKIVIQTDGSSAGRVNFEYDESGGTTPNESVAFLAAAALGAGVSVRPYVCQYIPAGGSYRFENQNDPNAANAVDNIREYTL